MAGRDLERDGKNCGECLGISLLCCLWVVALRSGSHASQCMLWRGSASRCIAPVVSQSTELLEMQVVLPEGAYDVSADVPFDADITRDTKCVQPV